MRLTFVGVSVVLLGINVFAQDPFKVAPQAYKLQFENDWVRVTRVHYAPHEKIPAHKHTLTASAYVYLNDGGPVVFNHIDKDYGAVTRPATKAGSFRLYRGIQELHEVENQSDLPSDFLRVEFKTEAVNEKGLRGRYYRETYPAGENFQKIQFENEQIRVTRLVCAPGKTIDIAASRDQPALLIALSPADFMVTARHQRLTLGLGQERWVGTNEADRFENRGEGPAELLQFDFKTRPLSKEELDRSSKHEHPSDT